MTKEDFFKLRIGQVLVNNKNNQEYTVTELHRHVITNRLNVGFNNEKDLIDWNDCCCEYRLKGKRYWLFVFTSDGRGTIKSSHLYLNSTYLDDEGKTTTGQLGVDYWTTRYKVKQEHLYIDVPEELC